MTEFINGARVGWGWILNGMALPPLLCLIETRDLFWNSHLLYVYLKLEYKLFVYSGGILNNKTRNVLVIKLRGILNLITVTMYIHHQLQLKL